MRLALLLMLSAVSARAGNEFCVRRVAETVGAVAAALETGLRELAGGRPSVRIELSNERYPAQFVLRLERGFFRTEPGREVLTSPQLDRYASEPDALPRDLLRILDFQSNRWKYLSLRANETRDKTLAPFLAAGPRAPETFHGLVLGVAGLWEAAIFSSNAVLAPAGRRLSAFVEWMNAAAFGFLEPKRTVIFVETAFGLRAVVVVADALEAATRRALVEAGLGEETAVVRSSAFVALDRALENGWSGAHPIGAAEDALLSLFFGDLPQWRRYRERAEAVRALVSREGFTRATLPEGTKSAPLAALFVHLLRTGGENGDALAKRYLALLSQRPVAAVGGTFRAHVSTMRDASLDDWEAWIFGAAR